MISPHSDMVGMLLVPLGGTDTVVVVVLELLPGLMSPGASSVAVLTSGRAPVSVSYTHLTLPTSDLV